MVIADHLSEEQKLKYIHSCLIPGAVIYKFCEFTKPPKEKYLLVVQVQSETTVLVINTSVNKFIQDRQHLLDCQVSIDVATNAFLEHDSFIDCTETQSLSTTDLIEEILKDMSTLRGQITSDIKTKVIAALNDCYTIEPYRIVSIVTSLSA